MRENKYGLRSKESGELLKYKVVHLTGNGETREIFELTDQGDKEWVLSDVEEVKLALKEKTAWYVSSFNKPLIKYPAYQLEIVQIDKYEKVEKYNEYTDRDKLNEYHQNRVELAMKVLSMDEEKKKTEQRAAELEKTSVIQELPFNELISNNTQGKAQEHTQETTKVDEQPKAKEIQQVPEKPVVEAVKQLVKGITKIKVQCKKSIPKEWGSLDAVTVSNCFEQGKVYLGYTKNGKFYVINEDKVPEFICNDSENKKWEDNFFFRSHFDVTEYIK